MATFINPTLQRMNAKLGRAIRNLERPNLSKRRTNYWRNYVKKYGQAAERVSHPSYLIQKSA